MLRSLFFSHDTAPTEIYTLSLHDALPIWPELDRHLLTVGRGLVRQRKLRHDVELLVDVEQLVAEGGEHDAADIGAADAGVRSEEHTSELQSHSDLVCRLLLEKKKTKNREI